MNSGQALSHNRIAAGYRPPHLSARSSKRLGGGGTHHDVDWLDVPFEFIPVHAARQPERTTYQVDVTHSRYQPLPAGGRSAPRPKARATATGRVDAHRQTAHRRRIHGQPKWPIIRYADGSVVLVYGVRRASKLCAKTSVSPVVNPIRSGRLAHRALCQSTLLRHGSGSEPPWRKLRIQSRAICRDTS